MYDIKQWFMKQWVEHKYVTVGVISAIVLALLFILVYMIK